MQTRSPDITYLALPSVDSGVFTVSTLVLGEHSTTPNDFVQEYIIEDKKNPCSEEKHIIRAAFQKTQRKNRIEITNSGDSLFVTFTNLQRSDSKKYYCGVDRFGPDSLIEVKLEVTDAESTTPRTTLKMLAVTNSSDSISDTSTSYIIYSTPAVDSTTNTTASSTQGAGNVLYSIICVVIIISMLMVLLTVVWKMKRKQQSKTHKPPHTYMDVEDVRPEGQSLNQPAAVSTLGYSADSDSVYANYTEIAVESVNNYSEDVPLNPVSSAIYSVIQLPEKQIEHTEHSKPNQCKYSENDSLYSLAQLPKTN
ncbi:hypothetical protein D9C73_020138 [Collichthys lucidus]|uniref:CMRF35-like molecule 8 n=1 Tax=Collichthys lucidus TaxID=240159 RepID=A0A4U5VEC0_COLLU|nr:hypothetical protein D9C73_020138 [Collichthys lucidus]